MKTNELKDILLKAKDAIQRGVNHRAFDMNSVLGGIDKAVKYLDGADLIDLNKVWHQAKDKMPDIYGGRFNDYLCA